MSDGVRQDLQVCTMFRVLTLWKSGWVYEAMVLQKPGSLGKLKRKTTACSSEHGCLCDRI